jgi:hypothetical protein
VSRVVAVAVVVSHDGPLVVQAPSVPRPGEQRSSAWRRSSQFVEFFHS